MTRALRASKIRLMGGGILVLAGLIVGLFLLPDASQQQLQKEKALAQAARASQSQMQDLQRAQAVPGGVSPVGGVNPPPATLVFTAPM